MATKRPLYIKQLAKNCLKLAREIDLDPAIAGPIAAELMRLSQENKDFKFLLPKQEGSEEPDD